MVEEVAMDTTEESTPDIVVGSDEYNKQMADKFDASQESTPEDTEEKVEIPEKPDGIPAKFYNKETGEVDYASLTKSYNELEKGRGKVKATPDATPKVNSDDAVVLAKVRHDEAKTKADAEGATQEDKDAFALADEVLTLAKADAITARKTTEEANTAKALVEKSGFDFDELTTEYTNHGFLSEESIASLVEGGIPEATVESYLAGQEALAAQWENEAKSIAGGKEAYATMITWASKTLAPEEIKAYDTAVNNRDIDQVKLAVSGLKAKYEDSNGREPTLLGGTTGGNTSAGGYASRQEMVKAMSDPRYGQDPSYRAAVANKVGKTTAF